MKVYILYTGGVTTSSGNARLVDFGRFFGLAAASRSCSCSCSWRPPVALVLLLLCCCCATKAMTSYCLGSFRARCLLVLLLYYQYGVRSIILLGGGGCRVLGGQRRGGSGGRGKLWRVLPCSLNLAIYRAALI